MTNELTNELTNNCTVCGANLTMVGKTHRCIPRSGASTNSLGASALSLAAPPETKGTYKYRDADKWRAYMRDLMRKRRADSRVV